jgi:2-polyprenyl-6-methoxyphenol hydroxylase-like FAD-dependent oxidoreductase
MALLPLPDRIDESSPHQVSLVWSTAGSGLLKTSEDLSAQLTAASHGVLGVLKSLGEMQLWPLRRSVAKAVVAPRQLLIGDAAHRVHPLAGQGLNLGLQDVAALVETLSTREAFRDLGELRLLKRYARARAMPVKAMSELTHQLWQATVKYANTDISNKLITNNIVHNTNNHADSIWVKGAKWLDGSLPAREFKRVLVRAAQGQL